MIRFDKNFDIQPLGRGIFVIRKKFWKVKKRTSIKSIFMVWKLYGECRNFKNKRWCNICKIWASIKLLIWKNEKPKHRWKKMRSWSQIYILRKKMHLTVGIIDYVFSSNTSDLNVTYGLSGIICSELFRWANMLVYIKKMSQV